MPPKNIQSEIKLARNFPMKWIMCLCLITSLMAAEETPFVCVEEKEPTGIAGKQLGYETRDATVLSMLGWGITIVVAIATFTALVKNHPAPAASSTSTP
jgi:hypothetical protein